MLLFCGEINGRPPTSCSTGMLAQTRSASGSCIISITKPLFKFAAASASLCCKNLFNLFKSYVNNLATILNLI